MKTILSAILLLILLPVTGSTKGDIYDIADISIHELLNATLKRTSLTDVPHFHSKGEWMISYKYHHMHMTGNRNDTDRLSAAEVLETYMVSPIAMNMKMHMIGVMYGATKKINFMGMLSFVDLSMEVINRMSMPFTTRNKELGDTKLFVLYMLSRNHKSQFFTTFGLSLPTGDINLHGDGAMGVDQKLPYPMQIGSGTIDPHLALTYIHINDNQSYGINVSSNLHLYNNSNDYRLGNQYSFSSWYSQMLGNQMTVFARTDGMTWSSIKGADPDLNPMMTPTADPELRGGTSLKFGAGINFSVGSGSSYSTKISLQYSKPVYQNLDGPQLETDNQLKIGIIFQR